jgi:hypothetical protein
VRRWVSHPSATGLRTHPRLSSIDEPQSSDFSSRAAETLRELGVEPVTIGARAALRYRATPRATIDVDYLIPRDVPGIAEAFRAQGLEVRSVMNDDGEAYLYLIKGSGDVLIDIVIADTEYQAQAYRRAVDGYLTVEDVIVHKLIAWRPRDQDDIRSILAASPPMDQTYIARWAQAWSVIDRWDDARRSAS